MVYVSSEVTRLRILLEDMIQNMALYHWEDIDDVAVQYQAALLCEAIDQDILDKLLTEMEQPNAQKVKYE